MEESQVQEEVAEVAVIDAPATEAPAPEADETPEGVEEGDLTSDQLMEDVIDEEKAEQTTKELLLPVGSWVTVPSGKSKFRVRRMNDRKRDPETQEWVDVVLPDGTTPSRRVASVFFRIQLIDRATGSVKENGAIQLSLSPDERRNDKGKWDLKTRIFLGARTACKQAGAYNGTVGSVLKYVEDYPVNLRVTQFTGDDGEARNLVMNLSRVRQ